MRDHYFTAANSRHQHKPQDPVHTTRTSLRLTHHASTIRLYVKHKDILLSTHTVSTFFDSITEAMVAAEEEAVACVDSQYKMHSR
jgi:hypothetical protein